MCLNFETTKNLINFPLGTTENLIFLGIPIPIVSIRAAEMVATLIIIN